MLTADDVTAENKLGEGRESVVEILKRGYNIRDTNVTEHILG